MRAVYETDADRDNELAVAREIGSLFNCRMYRNEQLNHIDYVAEWPNGKTSNVEIRCRPGMRWGEYNTVFLSAAKLSHAVQLYRQGQSFALFVKPADGGLYIWAFKPEHVRKLRNTWAGKNARTMDDPQWLVEIPISLFERIDASKEPKNRVQEDTGCST